MRSFPTGGPARCRLPRVRPILRPSPSPSLSLSPSLSPRPRSILGPPACPPSLAGRPA